MQQDGEGPPPQTLLAPIEGTSQIDSSTPPNYNFRKYDQNQQFLVPVSMKDWVVKGSKARFIDALFNSMDRDGALDPIYQDYRADGWGAPAYHPRMMAKTIFYGVCYGILSSRKLAWLTEINMELRYLSGNQTPNFRTICDFRNRHNSILSNLFVDVLELCAEAGLVSVGRVALDGTKMKANASMEKSYKRKTIARKIKELLEEARLIDEQEDDTFGSKRGDELPENLRSEEAQRMVIEEAVKRLAEAKKKEEEERAQKKKKKKKKNIKEEMGSQILDEEEVASVTESEDPVVNDDEGNRPTYHDLDKLGRMLDAYDQASQKEQDARDKQREMIEQREREEAESGKKKRGQKPTAPEDIQFPDRKGNITDPDSRIMKDGYGHYMQGFNCQAAVTCQGNQQIITACGVTQEETDYHQLRPMMEASEANVGEEADQWLADAGYYTDEHIDLFIGETEMLVNTKKGWKLLKEMRERGAPKGRIPEGLTTRQLMERKLTTKAGHRAYSDRFNAESIFGQFETRGFDRFYRRGIEKVETDWSTICSSSNMLKLYNSGNWSISDGYLHIEPAAVSKTGLT